MTKNILEKIKTILRKNTNGKMGSGVMYQLCCFLSSDEVLHITGETTHVNGGMYL